MNSTMKYVPWGFKLNMMYASVPPGYYRNIHNFNEFNAPRVDIGMLTGSMYEQPVYGFQSTFPHTAERFYMDRKKDIAEIVTKTLLEVGAISSVEKLSFPSDFDFFKFIPPTNDVELGNLVGGRYYPLFVYYGSGDSVGGPDKMGHPFLRIIAARLDASPVTQGKYRWTYHEFRVGRGEEQYQWKPFLAGPMFIAYTPNEYATIEFDENSANCKELYKKHSSYFQADERLKAPFEALIARETIEQLEETDQFVVMWDGQPAHRSIVVSQPYYDWDDDLQSAHIDAILSKRIFELETEVERLKRLVDISE